MDEMPGASELKFVGLGPRLREMLAMLTLEDGGGLQLLNASEVLGLGSENAVGEAPGSDRRAPWQVPLTTTPLLISSFDEGRAGMSVAGWLARFYPTEHGVKVIRQLPPTSAIETMALSALQESPVLHAGDVLYVPALSQTENTRTFSGLMEITRRLRAPGGCPWDREQTRTSLKPHLLEETYEVLDALDSNDPKQLAEELGDLLFQVTIHSQVAAEAGEFTVEDVIEHIVTKLIGRHPHVFGELSLSDAHDVRRHWEGFKQREKPKRSSVLEQIPRGLPALPQSNLMQKRAASVGFEWPALAEVMEKMREELGELERTADKAEQGEEYGDILFALVSVGRHLQLDPEESLRLANRKFAARFQYVEGRVSALDTTLRDLSPEELDVYWQEAKSLGTARQTPEEVTAEDME
ncbi:MAG: nucleoside triphosphate pyrophosphohydrolase [Chloroflexota bacterium]